jgi:hypothetical protein
VQTLCEHLMATRAVNGSHAMLLQDRLLPQVSICAQLHYNMKHILPRVLLNLSKNLFEDAHCLVEADVFDGVTEDAYCSRAELANLSLLYTSTLILAA